LIKPLAIHDCPLSFSDRWLEYCREKNIEYRIVDCFSSDIIDQLRDCSALLWHWGLRQPQSFIIARSVIAAAEAMGLKVFPNTATAWHYDDKLAQKYLLEAIGAPLVETTVFYNEDDARKWLAAAEFPLVFKLRSGSASANVRLVKSRGEAINLCRQAFRSGFRSVPGYFYDTPRKLSNIRNLNNFMEKLKRLPKAWQKIMMTRNLVPLEKGYIYFQKFIPDNLFDIRVTVIGGRAFAFTRDVRPHDFRASGSGFCDYDRAKIPMDCIKAAFEITGKINAQSLACDFIQDAAERVLITEISYGYQRLNIAEAPGHWNQKLEWQSGSMAAEDAILEDLMEDLNRTHRS